MKTTAEDLQRDIARAVWDAHFEGDNARPTNSKDSCDEQVYQLEVLRLKLATLAIEVRHEGCTYEALQRALYRRLR